MLNRLPFGENGGASGGEPSRGPGWQGAKRPKLGEGSPQRAGGEALSKGAPVSKGEAAIRSFAVIEN